MKIIILGAGLAGLGLGRILWRLGSDVTILEKESQAGGLCRTNRTGEYYWDFGVHAMYSRHQEMIAYFRSLPIDKGCLDRNVKILHATKNGKKKLLSYPFEVGVKDLPIKSKLECILSYFYSRIRTPGHPDSSLEGWIDRFMGQGIARYFMIPYNEKIWNCKLSEISKELITEKIDPMPTTDFIFSVLGKKISARPYQAKFVYPRQGIQKFIDYLAKDIAVHIELNANVVKLIKSGYGWSVITEQRKEYRAEALISTIPLVELLKKIDVEGLQSEYNAFKWNNTYFVMAGLKKGYNFQVIKDCHWVFFKKNEVFYRLTLMHNFSSEFLPAIVAEITQKGDVCEMSEEEIKEIVIKDLIGLGIIGSKDWIAETDIKLLQYTYPIPTMNITEVKDMIKNILKKHSLFLFGRSGDWSYVNMDEVIMGAKTFISNHADALGIISPSETCARSDRMI